MMGSSRPGLRATILRNRRIDILGQSARQLPPRHIAERQGPIYHPGVNRVRWRSRASFGSPMEETCGIQPTALAFGRTHQSTYRRTGSVHHWTMWRAVQGTAGSRVGGHRCPPFAQVGWSGMRRKL